MPPPIDYGRRSGSWRGLHRVFATAEHRFYRANDGTTPDPTTATAYATASSLPATPAVTFADGTWRIVVTYFDGIHESDPLALGPNGETYVRLEIASGATVANPPQPAFEAELQQRAGGVVAVVALYDEDDSTGLRADAWVVTATYDGSAPAEDSASPTLERAMPSAGLAALDYELPAQAHGTTVKVRVQTRRDGPVWSNDSTILSTTADATGPSAPPGGVAWRGSLPESS